VTCSTTTFVPRPSPCHTRQIFPPISHISFAHIRCYASSFTNHVDIERAELNGTTFLLEDDGGSFWGFQFFNKHFVFALVSLRTEYPQAP